ncbi:MAG: T9SS type A sorting domain-containing protein [Bacteroidales bacterium]|jgi:hypothetical protein|nr:T9SS type A sorting domain-containing protein [Bacteroidales bacterium]
MKKIYFLLKVAFCTFVLLSVLIFNSSGQSFIVEEEGSLLQRHPCYMRGYVVVNNVLYPDPDKIIITITANYYGENDQLITDTVYVTELSGTNYVRLPEEYFLSDSEGVGYSMNIVAYNMGGTVIGYEDIILNEPPGIPHYNSSHSWGCNGYNYAWRIIFHNKMDDNGNTTGSGYLTLSGHGQEVTTGTYNYYIPYYVYVTMDDWNALTNTQQKYDAVVGRHGLIHMYDFQYGVPPDNDGTGKVIELSNVNSGDGLIGYYGQIVTGNTVFGLQKIHGGYPLASYKTPIIGPVFTNTDLMYAIGLMSTYSPGYGVNYPELECDSWNGSMPSGPSGINQNSGNFFRCIESTDWTKPSYQAFKDLRNCMKNNSSPRVILGKINMYRLIGKDYSTIDPDIPDTGMEIHIGENYSVKEIMNTKSVKYPAGLYSVRLTFDDGSVVYTPIEFSNGINFDNVISDYIEADLYPNPITSDVFYIDFESQIDGKINAIYSIYNESGKLIYNKNISIPNGNYTMSIEDADLVKNKMYIHVIEFEDNSKISISSI